MGESVRQLPFCPLNGDMGTLSAHLVMGSSGVAQRGPRQPSGKRCTTLRQAQDKLRARRTAIIFNNFVDVPAADSYYE